MSLLSEKTPTVVDTPADLYSLANRYYHRALRDFFVGTAIMNKYQLRNLFNMIETGVQQKKRYEVIMREILETAEKGEQSQKNVEEALCELPFIAEIRAHEKWSNADYKNGVDITVTLTADNPFNLDENLDINIQVKSSATGIKDAITKIKTTDNLITPEDYDRFIGKKRLIFINGNNPDTVQLQAEIQDELLRLAYHILRLEAAKKEFVNQVLNFLHQ